MKAGRSSRKFGISAITLAGLASSGWAADDQDAAAARLESMKQQLAEQTRQLETLKRALAQQETALDELRRAVGAEALVTQRQGSAANGQAAPQVNVAKASEPAPVGRPPDRDSIEPAVAPIFEQPGVLTPTGKFTLEPSMQYSYSSTNRVALVGYTIIPAIQIGLINVQEVKRNTVTGVLTGRYGVTNRFELEARLPYSYRSDTSIGRPLGTGSATDSVFEASGQGIGDIEVTGRYQFNEGGLDSPYYIGSLRLKSRTGKDPFEVQTSDTVQGFNGTSLQSELPTGSGFYGVQPALTMLYPSDPAVFFGTVSYLYSVKRNNIVSNTTSGPQNLGSLQPGGIWGFNFGMGLALNERSSFSIGYDHSSVGRTTQNGATVPDSVRVQIGTLLLGYSYKLSPQRSLNVSLGGGLTRDTPDVTLTMRLPYTF